MKAIKQAWMDTYGNIYYKYEHKISFHNELARELLLKLYNLPFKEAMIETSKICGYRACFIDLLEHYGCIRLHKYPTNKEYNGQSKWIIPYNTELTPSQKDKIIDWCVANKTKWDNAVEII